jgi:hypothetical protein
MTRRGFFPCHPDEGFAVCHPEGAVATEADMPTKYNPSPAPNATMGACPFNASQIADTHQQTISDHFGNSSWIMLAKPCRILAIVTFPNSLV